MGTARSVLFTVASIIMIVSGIAGMVVLFIMMRERINAYSSSIILLLISSCLLFICNILNIISGARGLSYINRRSNSAVIIRLPQTAVFICLFAVILSFFNGVNAWHITIIILTGLVIPILFMYAAVKKSYV